ncbi:methyl-CpG-binding domain protein 1a [Polypterus senegalus]|nr:methyl-CpG-binding domain protein 1a [Polypterus senegalus]XP_039630956.1 methyl-CpG-binding domain protein 1a [Polypterus senegalus]XP_039630957.1 methyl-CpG-binding domain protein 1a [Polypterus senegalus]
MYELQRVPSRQLDFAEMNLDTLDTPVENGLTLVTELQPVEESVCQLHVAAENGEKDVTSTTEPKSVEKPICQLPVVAENGKNDETSATDPHSVEEPVCELNNEAENDENDAASAAEPQPVHEPMSQLPFAAENGESTITKYKEKDEVALSNKDEVNSENVVEMEVDVSGNEDNTSLSVANKEVSLSGVFKKELKVRLFPKQRKKKTGTGENWEDWPILGEGWKRKEVFRRSGLSMGKTDTYYLSPDGLRMRSKIELVSYLGGELDLSDFDFKSGCFVDPDTIRKANRWDRKRNDKAKPEKKPRRKKKPAMENDGMRKISYTPEKNNSMEKMHGSVKTPPNKMPTVIRMSPSMVIAPPKQSTPNKFSPPKTSSTQKKASSGFSSSFPSGEALVVGCDNCGQPFTDIVFAKAGQQSLCSDCKPSLNMEDGRNIVFRKWLPCGQCIACRVTVDCGMCASCRHKLLNPDSRKPVRCRKRKCLQPIRKKRILKGPRRMKQPKISTEIRKKRTNRLFVFDQVGQKMKRKQEANYSRKLQPLLKMQNFEKIRQEEDVEETRESTRESYSEAPGDAVRETRKQFEEEKLMELRKIPAPQYSEPEDFFYFCVENDQERDHDDNDGPKKRSRRSCGKCEACLRTTDCRTCDFCQDKPKFGGRNKKRQKCRLRQCQVEAMRHLLPFQKGRSKHMADVGWLGPGRSRTRPSINSKSRKTKIGKTKKTVSSWNAWDVFEFNEDDVEISDEPTESRAVGTDSQECFRNNYGNIQIVKVSEYQENGQAQNEECYRSDFGNIQVLKIPDFPEDGQVQNEVYAALETDVIYQPQDIAFHKTPVAYEKSQTTFSKSPPNLPKDLQPKDPINTINLGEDVEIVQVDTGEDDDDVEEVTPVITEIYSLAGSSTENSMHQELLQFLDSIRQVPLPAYWVGLAVDGPKIQLVQCSKLSTMADTVVQIEPGFFYQIIVQGQPLLLSHPLYEDHPLRLCTVSNVVGLLMDLEKHQVCPGYPNNLPGPHEDPILLVRAAACDLLVQDERCDKCSITPLVI